MISQFPLMEVIPEPPPLVLLVWIAILLERKSALLARLFWIPLCRCRPTGSDILVSIRRSHPAGSSSANFPQILHNHSRSSHFFNPPSLPRTPDTTPAPTARQPPASTHLSETPPSATSPAPAASAPDSSSTGCRVGCSSIAGRTGRR